MELKYTRIGLYGVYIVWQASIDENERRCSVSAVFTTWLIVVLTIHNYPVYCICVLLYVAHPHPEQV